MINAAGDTLRAIKEKDMSRYQVLIVILCILIAALDGFDVLVVAYTGPAISKDWGLVPQELGILFSAGLAGMGVGALAVAPIGDIFGRKPTILLCTIMLCAGMGLSALAADVAQLSLMRFITGLGIGAILANVNIMVSEYASNKRRALCISLMAIGYPVGATLGGLCAVYLIEGFGWRSVYVFGSLLALVLLPILVRFLPESLDYLVVNRPENALARVNKILQKIGITPLASLGGDNARGSIPSIRPKLFKGALGVRIMASCAVYFCVMSTCYFLLSWTPQILTQSGATQSMGISGSLVMNIGGIVGCLIYGVMAQKLGGRKLASLFMAGLFVAATAFAAVPVGGPLLMLSAAAVGFCLYTAINALYFLVPSSLPAEIRSTGTGVAMAAGRLGAVAGPLLAGFLMAMGLSKVVFVALLSVPMLLAAVLVYSLRTHQATLEPVSVSSPIDVSEKNATA